MLVSWELLLNKLSEGIKESDTQARFEIAELKGLATSVIRGDDPRENLKRLIADVVKRVEQSGWANTSGLAVGTGYDFYGRYLRLGGVFAWFGTDDKATGLMPDGLLWLWLYLKDDAPVEPDTVRSRLSDDIAWVLEGHWRWHSGRVCIPISLPAGTDREGTIQAIVAELERIATLIDPSGPTYRI